MTDSPGEGRVNPTRRKKDQPKHQERNGHDYHGNNYYNCKFFNKTEGFTKIQNNFLCKNLFLRAEERRQGWQFGLRSALGWGLAFPFRGGCWPFLLVVGSCAFLLGAGLAFQSWGWGRAFPLGVRETQVPRTGGTSGRNDRMLLTLPLSSMVHHLWGKQTLVPSHNESLTITVTDRQQRRTATDMRTNRRTSRHTAETRSRRQQTRIKRQDGRQ